MEKFYKESSRISEVGKQYLDHSVGMKMAISKSEALKICVKYICSTTN